MLIFKVPTRIDNPSNDEHTGYYYTDSKREAKAHFKENGADPDRGDEIEELELAVNSRDILRFLNQHCSYPDNG